MNRRSFFALLLAPVAHLFMRRKSLLEDIAAMRDAIESDEYFGPYQVSYRAGDQIWHALTEGNPPTDVRVYVDWVPLVGDQ